MRAAIKKIQNLSSNIDKLRANCSQTTSDRFSSVVVTGGLGMLALGGGVSKGGMGGQALVPSDGVGRVGSAVQGGFPNHQVKKSLAGSAGGPWRG